MAMTRWNPYRELEDMSTRASRVFGQDEEHDALEAFSEWAPAVDIEEDREAFHVKVELPAVDKDDLRVDVTNGVLTIAGERRRERGERDKRMHRVERCYGAFERAFTLPDGVDEDHVEASFEAGILDVMLPKLEQGGLSAHTIELR